MVQPQVICVSDGCVRSWAPEFILLGGYDQEPGIMPSSQQDEDLKTRLWRASKQVAQNQFYLRERDTVVNEIQLQKNDRFCFLVSMSVFHKPNLNTYNRLFLQVGIGSAIPNAETKGKDRGTAKIANADPDLLKTFPSWVSMKKESAKLLRDKEHQLVRNFADKVTMQTEMHLALSDDAALNQIWQAFQSSCIAEFSDAL